MIFFPTLRLAAIVILAGNLCSFCSFTSFAQTQLTSSTIAVSRDGIHHKAPTSLKAAVFPLNNNPLKFKVCIENMLKGNTLIVLKDGRENIIHKKVVIHSLVYVTRFDMSHMQEGTYTIEITNASEVHRFQIHLIRAIVRSLQVNPGKFAQARR